MFAGAVVFPRGRRQRTCPGRPASGSTRPAPGPPMLVSRTAHGLYLPDADLHLDARTAPGTVFVSHAHSDHCSSAARILCTPETAALHEARRGRREATTVAYGESVRVGRRDGDADAGGARARLGDDRRRVGARAGGVHRGLQAAREPVLAARGDPAVRRAGDGVHVRRAALPLPARRGARAPAHAFVDDALAAGATPVVLAYALGKGQEALWHLLRGGTTWCCTAPSRTCATCTCGSGTPSRPRGRGGATSAARSATACCSRRRARARRRWCSSSRRSASCTSRGGPTTRGAQHLPRLRPRAPALRPRGLRRAGSDGPRERRAQGVHDARPGELRRPPPLDRHRRRALGEHPQAAGVEARP
jgi:hypothetical protein